jgi:heme exporter protein C
MSSSSPDRAFRTLHRASAIALGVCAIGYGFLVVNAPMDSVQGVLQKILYLHVPCAIAAYLGFLLTAIGGGLYLWMHDERFDRFAASAAEVGVFFCALVLITGPIWGRGTWGSWWSWDLRLTLTLLLFLVYLSYLLLRSFTEGSERTARFAAVYGIAGVAVIPLNYLAIDLAGGRSIHPENLEGGSLGAGMAMPFAAGIITALVAFSHLLLGRIDIARLRAELAEREADREMRGGDGSPWHT